MEVYVIFLTDHLVPQSMTREEVKEECQKDAEIQARITAIGTNCYLGKLLGNSANNKNVNNVDLMTCNGNGNELTVP